MALGEMDGWVTEAYLNEQLQYGGDVIAIRDGEIERLQKELADAKAEIAAWRLKNCEEIIREFSWSAGRTDGNSQEG